ncbi:ribosomal protein S18 acetylase RimI-like enzyme [Rhizobium sp. BK619]|uniref:GNAT family N-acetyltransferase n=1 Tax=Rhizobium sp. BK619 TaxID=2586989 RepID=UPI00160BA41E|nr:GNAT family N-acetyltransferase [Rhizobium sp. BK619]MBB3648934.1 ribosomal protein S18 acetylase RimI-like enzyme [Rhizobium sp. BK619]
MIDVRMATPDEDEVLVRHYLKIWDSYGTPPEHYRPDAAARILSFIRSGREERCLTSFLAIVDGEIAGSASCQLHQSPFPEVIREEQRLHGYIWSVYVADAFRRRGIASALTNKAADYLKSIGCTTAVIHASDAGEPVYRAARFELAKEMRLQFPAE